ncbi:hypothetical protein ACFFGR_08750 [Arthrobacter liuii]|uniref:Uncharacterized protein n=1 Tax=Arthrobacter liuii TaxID=1476996 RepID=A0ABQ2AU80_9MICC|nr:hypothetical protein [Arthrobacter liuii]GGH97621.1 hypothetical protein GCM10007170_28290 [Arthrobacter liuii]
MTSNQDAPLGWFHAVKTRDAVAQTRDGWPYFEANARGSDPTGATVFEIRFGDGEWMLAVEGDLLKRDQ